MFFLLIISLYTSRIVFHALGVEDFGIYNVVGGIIVLLSFMSNSMSLAVNRFLSFDMGLNKGDNLNKIFSMSINIHLLLAVIILILGETLGLWFINTQLVIPPERIIAANWIFQFSIISITLEIIRATYTAVAISHEDMHIYTYGGIIEGIMKLSIAFLIIRFKGDKLVLYGFLLVIVNFLIFTLYYLWGIIKYPETKYHLIWDKKLFNEIFSFAGISLMGNSSTVIVAQGQNVLLNIFFGPILNAARGISFQIQGALSMFVAGIYTAITPQITKSFASDDREYLVNIITRSSLIGSLGLMVFVIPAILEMPYIVYLWLGDSYPSETILFSQLILFSLLLYNLIKPVMIAIQSSGKIFKMHLYCSIVSILNLPIDYILLKVFYFEAYWVFIIYAITGFVYIVIVLLVAKKTIAFNTLLFLKKVILPVFFIGLATSVLLYILHSIISAPMIRTLLECFFSVIIIILMTFLIILSRNERSYIQKKIYSIIYRKSCSK